MMVSEQKGARLPRGCEREELHREIGKEETTGGSNGVDTKVACLLGICDPTLGFERLTWVSWVSLLLFAIGD